MADNKNKQGFQDDSKIDINDSSEVAYACKQWGIERETLKKAIASVGTGRKKIHTWLLSAGYITNTK